MKSFLLFILSLTAGCEASSEVEGCEGGWVELTCKYPKEDQEYEKIEVINQKGSSMQIIEKDVWDGDDKLSLYHDAKNKNLRMVIKQIEQEDSGEYKCVFYQRSTSSGEQEMELEVEKDFCQTPFTQTAYETAKTTITCDFPKEYNSYVKFICKDNNETCEEILSTQSSVKSNGTFTLRDTNRFNVSISNVSSQHAGVYWCGIKSKEGNYRVSRKKIQLEIKMSDMMGTPETEMKGCEGGWVEFTCKYPREEDEKIQVINPKGSSIQTTKKDVWDGDDRFSLYHDTRNKNLRMAIKQIEHEDSGKYKCKFDQKPGSYKKQEQEMELNVEDDGCQTPFTQTANETAKTTITCDFPKKYNSYDKFICKDNNETCEEILLTHSSVKSNGTFTLTDTNSFNISISNVSSQHAGVYWCGVKSKEGSAKGSLRKIRLKIGELRTRSPKRNAIIITVICVAVLLLVLIVVLIYRRCSKYKTNEEGLNNAEDFVYEDIDEPPHKPGTALKTIYVSAKYPTNPSAFTHYSNINHPNSSVEVSGDTYSTVTDIGQYSTVNHPSGFSEYPLYSTVNKPQEH